MHIHAGPPVDLGDLRDREIDTAVLADATERILAAITAQLAMIRGGKPPAVRHDPRAVQTPPGDQQDDAGAA